MPVSVVINVSDSDEEVSVVISKRSVHAHTSSSTSESSREQAVKQEYPHAHEEFDLKAPDARRENMKKSLNDATAKELRGVHGIGEVLAGEILKKRPYHSWASLQAKVLMIGAGRIRALKEKFSLDEDGTEEPEVIHATG